MIEDFILPKSIRTGYESWNGFGEQMEACDRFMSTRAKNEKRFDRWEEREGGGRIYCLEVVGRHGWTARYLKEVAADETTLRFWQEVFDESLKLVEIHEKFPVDKGHRKV